MPTNKFTGERYTYAPIAAIISCQDCGIEAPSYKNAQAWAAVHSRRYKHRVSGELTIVIVYDNRGLKDV